MGAWERFRGWPVLVQVPAMVVVGAGALALGYGLGNFVPAGRTSTVRPVAALAGTTTTTAQHEIRSETTQTRAPAAAVAVSPAAAAPTSTAAAGAAPRTSDPVVVRVVCDAVALEVVGRVLTESEGAEAVRLYQEQERTAPRPAGSDLAPAVDAFCRKWVKGLAKVPGAPGAANLPSSTN